MDAKIIQSRVDAIAKAMLGKGLCKPKADLQFSSDEQPCAGARWEDANARYGSTEFEYIRANTVDEALTKLDAFIAAKPEAEERKLNEFMSALGNVIDLGRANGIDVEYVNPLAVMMQRLSENALTHQKVAAE
jgi:hypothetical protein